MNGIPVIYSFARSGGTLVNQLLGSHRDCLVLSEVNPAAAVKPVAQQAIEWLALAAPDEARELAAMPYARQVGLLRERAEAAGKRLVVRDWVTVNFLPGTAGDLAAPSGLLEQQIYLARAGLEPLPLVVARRSAAVYASIKRSFAHLHRLAEEVFAQSYLRYARTVAGLPTVHIEALRRDPGANVGAILGRFGLDTGELAAILANFADFRNCTGNTTLRVENESAKARRILPPENTVARPEGAGAAFIEADGLLGYDR